MHTVNKKELVLVLGGARSGKSSWALRYVEEHYLSYLFLATAQVRDREMAKRVQKHKASRGPNWGLLEEPLEIVDALTNKCGHVEAVLIDCLDHKASRPGEFALGNVWSQRRVAGQGSQQNCLSLGWQFSSRHAPVSRVDRFGELDEPLDGQVLDPMGLRSDDDRDQLALLLRLGAGGCRGKGENRQQTEMTSSFRGVLAGV